MRFGLAAQRNVMNLGVKVFMGDQRPTIAGGCGVRLVVWDLGCMPGIVFLREGRAS